jgi:Domain of unknown function (DUF4124)
MHRGWYILLSGLALGAFSVAHAASQSGSGPVYKWTDEKGVVHYGDSVPPEYSQGERSVLNSRGVEIGHVDGVNNATATAERARAAESAKERAQHDQFLTSTYLSTKDIEQLRDERLGQIDGQIKASAVYIDGLDNRMLALVDRSSHFKPYSSDPNAKRMPDDLVEELVRVSSESNSQRQALDAKHKEEVEMRAQFDADITRFRELTAKPRS